MIATNMANKPAEFVFVSEQQSRGHPMSSMNQWPGDERNSERNSFHEAVKSGRYESEARAATFQHTDSHQPTATMSMQCGTHHHSHNHNHNHLHYYAPSADVHLRCETPNQELSYYRNYQTQYYAHHAQQPADSARYQVGAQLNSATANHDSNYSVASQDVLAGSTSNNYQSASIYTNVRNHAYCQQHRAYQPHEIIANSLNQDSSTQSYVYPNQLHQHQGQPHQQNYGAVSSGQMNALHTQPAAYNQTTLDIESANNHHSSHSRPAYAHYEGATSNEYRDYYPRQQYNIPNSYQYPIQEPPAQIISQAHTISDAATTSTNCNQQTEQQQQQQQPSKTLLQMNRNSMQYPSKSIITLTRPIKDHASLLRKRVRESRAKREGAQQAKGTSESKIKSRSLKSNPIPNSNDEKQSSKTNQCHICNRHYARPSTLKTHLRTHTNERPYKCSVCCKTFSQAANLTAHQRVHTGERPFPCPVCGRQFSQSSSVITHLRTHSGERPYRCNMCHRTFSDSSTLTKHCRIHSGEKPYQCDYCQLNFSQSGNLSRHIRLHIMNGLRNPLRVSTPARDSLLQPHQATAASSSSSANSGAGDSIPASFSSSSSNSSTTSTSSF